MNRLCRALRGAGMIVACLMTGSAIAECVSPILTPTECDFKHETTHLIGLQPAWSFAKEDRVKELISQGESFLDNYYAGVKVTGDVAQRFMIAPAAVEMGMVQAEELIQKAIILKNDPFKLKTVTDIVCDIYWDVIETVTDVPRDCPSTRKMLTDLKDLKKLDEVRKAVMDVVFNPDVQLGEVWDDSAAEIEAIRNRLQSPETFGRNIPLAEIQAKYAERYPALADLLAAPNETAAEYQTRVASNLDSRRDTIRDHLMATHQAYQNLTGPDKEELKSLEDRSKRAVGTMQAVELQNMLQMQSVQGVQMMSEELLNQGAMMIQDEANRLDEATRRRAVTEKALTPIPGHEVKLGNSAVFKRKHWTPPAKKDGANGGTN